MYSTLDGENAGNGIKQAMDIVRRALSAAHELQRVYPQTAELRKVRESRDYDACFSIAQKYLGRYRPAIDFYSPLTHIIVIDIQPEKARSQSIEIWKDTLSFIEMIIYLDAALIYGSKTAIEHAIKRAFQIQ